MAIGIGVESALGTFSRNNGLKGRQGDLGLSSLHIDGCLLICFGGLYDAFLLNMLIVQINFVSRRHHRRLGVGG